MKDPDLWNRLTGHDFPLDDKGKTLLSHLVNDTSLGADKSRVALTEYRKFLYLAATSGEIVAPSPLIDRIWHSHIEHTRAYFEDFCPRIIGKVIHHAPGRDGAGKDPAYQRTLALYAQEFRQTPLDKVWPSQNTLQQPGWPKILGIGGLAAMILGLATRGTFPGLGLAAIILGLICIALAIGLPWHDRPWTLRPRRDGTGCSSCGGVSSGDGGGCGGGD